MEGSSRREREREKQAAMDTAALLAALEAEKEARIPPDMMRELVECFALFDKENTGEMDLKQLVLALKGLGITLTDTEQASMLEEIDPQNTGIVRFNDFANLAADKIFEQDDFTQLKRAFAIFDRDDDGFLPMDRFVKLMTTLGDPLTPQEAKECGKLGDLRDQGIVIYNDLIAILCAK